MLLVSNILTPDRVLYAVMASSQKKTFEVIAETCSHLEGTGPTFVEIFDALVNRERLGTTAIGQGVALPHASVENAPSPIGCFLFLKKGVDFEAADQKLVDILFSIIFPLSATFDYHQLLEDLKNQFLEETFQATLRQATCAQDLYEQLIRI